MYAIQADGEDMKQTNEEVMDEVIEKVFKEKQRKDRWKWFFHSWKAVTKWFFHSWKAVTKWITPVLCAGVILVIVSIFLIAFQKALLLAAGTAMLAAGLTIITTTLTGKETTRKQFAKESNILRKDTIYARLFIK